MANTLSKEDQLGKDWKTAWDAFAPIRASWTEKEQSLLAQVNDSFSGNVTYAKITDAALSTLAFERQARIAAQLPTGRVIAVSKDDEASAKLANVALNRYIIPNADSQHPMLVKQRLWGVYASVYGSMPMFYDYRVDDRYIGPDCWLTDPRSFAIQPGQSSTQDADYAFISNLVTTGFIRGVLKRDTTTWNKSALRNILKQAEAEGAKPAALNDATRQSAPIQARYDDSGIIDQVELVTKYEAGDDGHWITFAPDYDNKIVRDIPNPHKSGRIPIVMRHCFPLLNSIFGLGDYERGMRIQKAKDSLTNLLLEGAKNRIFPALKINPSLVTLSTIKNQANARWIVQDMNGVNPVQYGNQAMAEYQATWGNLQSMLMNQFGTTDTSINQDQTGNPAFGKTPQAIQMLNQRQNARDTWDMFMHEQATQELYEGMLNLLTVKMEKPINFSVFEEDIKQIQQEFGDKGLKTFKNGNEGIMTATKQQLKSNVGYRFIIDTNSSMSQNAQEQFQALSETWQVIHGDPNAVAALQQSGYQYDEAEHLKAMFIAAGVNDWDKILQKLSDQQTQQQGGQGGIPPQVLQLMAQQQQGQQQQAPPQPPPPKQPSETINYKDAPPFIQAQIEKQAGLIPDPQHQLETQTAIQQHSIQHDAQATLAGQQAAPSQPNFKDPAIAQVANQLMNGGGQNG